MDVKETATPYQPSKKHYTYADYVQLPDDGMRYEIIEGELFMSPAPIPLHQRVLRELVLALTQFVKKTLVGEILFAPIDVVLGDDNVVQPDILLIFKKNEKIITEKNIQGAPDLIVEILSPGTAYNDLINKKDLYQKFGVQEYWIVDPLKQWIEIYTVQGQEYTLHQRASGSGSVTSRILEGLTIQLKDIFPKSGEEPHEG